MTPTPLRCLKQQLETYLHTARIWQRILSPSAQAAIETKVIEYKTLLVIVEKALEKSKSDDPSPNNTTAISLSEHKKRRSAY